MWGGGGARGGGGVHTSVSAYGNPAFIRPPKYPFLVHTQIIIEILHIYPRQG